MFNIMSFKRCAAHAALLASSLWASTLQAGNPDCECGKPKHNLFWQHRLPPVGRDCKCETPSGTECSCPPQGPFFGYFPTCWHRWPQPWQPCPVTEWESCQLGRAGHDGVVVPVQELPPGTPVVETAPTPPPATPTPADGSQRAPLRPQVDGQKAVQAPTSPVLQSSSRRAAGPIAAGSLTAAPQSPTVAPQSAKLFAAPAAPTVAVVENEPTNDPQPVVAEPQPEAVVAVQTPTATPVQHEPEVRSVLVKSSAARAAAVPSVPKAVAKVETPAPRTKSSVPVRTVAVESKPANKPAPVGSRYGASEAVAASAAPVAPSQPQSSNPLRSRSADRTAELANATSDNPLRR